MEPSFKAVADHALLVSFADEINDETHARVIALDNALIANPPAGFIETVPALVNLLVSFDPLTTDAKKIESCVRYELKVLEKVVGTESVQPIRRLVQVCYDHCFAPDLTAVAQAKAMHTDDVIRNHLNASYRVLMYGFSPGYAYMGGVPESIQVPRKKSAVRDVPAGSVIIAGSQCLITTITMPTGWSIIGRSPTPILNTNPERPFLFDVGDEVEFERIDAATYQRKFQEIGHG